MKAELRPPEGGSTPVRKAGDPENAARELGSALGIDVYPASIFASGDAVFALGKKGGEKLLVAPAEGGFDGEERRATLAGRKIGLKLCRMTRENAALLRKALPFTAPKVIGVAGCIGLGDRLGVAAPGHIRAARKGTLRPFLAQQSARELARTGRSPEDVLYAAAFGALQEGFEGGFGSDADHLKNENDVNAFFKAGFTMFTLDPGEHVDCVADTAQAGELTRRFDGLPWKALEISPGDCRRKYEGRQFKLPGGEGINFGGETLARAAVKYGGAVAHAAKLFRHLADKAGARAFELEISVDETSSPTTIQEHFYVASELARLGVRFESIAPRFPGAFEKGIDYKGDLGAFEKNFAGHTAIAKHLGPYKISIHSGSDKFSIYPSAARHAAGMVHVKTAGTSYLEALRVIAAGSPALFRKIFVFALGRYAEDKASYHVSADAALIKDAAQDAKLPALLDDDCARQVLHVTFGSVLNAKDADGAALFKDAILAELNAHEDDYYAALEKHLGRHVAPFN